MKKMIALILAAALCLSMCACGKSKEAQAVDDLILAIGEVTAESKDAVLAAEEAYNALSDKDKEAVENLAVLEEARATLFEIELYDLTNRLLEIYYACEKVCDGTRIIWDNVGSSDFWTYYNAVRMLVLDITKAEYDALFGQNMYATVWCAASGLCPSKVDGTKISDSAMEETIDLAYYFNTKYALAEDNMPVVEEDVRIFREKYGDEYEDEVDTLNELCLEVSMYTDFTLEPSGSLSSYTSKNSEYIENIERLIKIMDSYR